MCSTAQCDRMSRDNRRATAANPQSCDFQTFSWQHRLQAILPGKGTHSRLPRSLWTGQHFLWSQLTTQNGRAEHSGQIHNRRWKLWPDFILRLICTFLTITTRTLGCTILQYGWRGNKALQVTTRPLLFIFLYFYMVLERTSVTFI